MLSRTLLVASLLAAPALAQTGVFVNNTPPGTNLQLGDDDTFYIQLPFPFPFNGTLVSLVTVSSNGFVWLVPNSGSDLSDSETELLSQDPRIAVYWDDLDPEDALAGGGVFYNETPTTAHIIWKDVPRFGSTSVYMNMELVLSVTGQIDLHYEATTGISTSSSITGISAGNGALPNPLDLSALPASTSPNIANATGYELFAANTFDLAGTTTTLIPTTTTDYLAITGSTTNLPPQPGPTLPNLEASSSTYGYGCPGVTSGTWYELFPQNTVDLSNTSWRFIASGGNTYVATPGSGFDPGYTAADILTQGDDSQVNCPFGPMGTFPFMGAQLSSVDVCSNGFVWMSPNASNDYSPSPSEFASLDPRLAPMWTDLTFSSTGTFYWTATATHCMATWENVPCYGASSTSNTLQCKFYPTGDIEFSYLAVVNTSGTAAIVGLSGGSSTPMPPVDITAGANPFVDLTPQTSSVPALTHTGNTPLLGSSYDLTTSDVPAGALFGATVLGFTRTNIDLGPLGAPACSQYVANVAAFFNALSGATSFMNSVPIPNFNGLAGFQFASQGAVYVPGINALNAVTSNGRLANIGF